MGGRVAPTNKGSIFKPGCWELMVQTPNMPRTHATIWGAPNAIAIPKMAPIHHPQEIRLAIAMPPSTMTRMIATGVSHSRMFSWREVTPVRNGDAWANTSPGVLAASTVNRGCLMRIKNSLFLRQFPHATALRIEFLALGRAGSPKPEGGDPEIVVVLLRTLLVDPVTG